MTQLLVRGLAHYWRWQVGLALGVMVAAGVIAGSLVTGDSVRATLARQAELRLGKIGSAVVAVDGFFTESLAARVPGAVPTMLLQGTVAVPDQNRRANAVNVYGVRDDFWALGTNGKAIAIGDGVVINTALAKMLGIARNGGRQAEAQEPTKALSSDRNSEVLVRLEKPSLISRDAPLSGESDQTVTLRGPVVEVRADEAMGALSLKAQQEPALNLFVPLARLQAAVALPGRANLLLSTIEQGGAAAVSDGMTLEDTGLTWQATDDQQILSTGRIFLAPDLAAAAQAALPEARGVLTYLVNQIRSESGAITPYSMATAAAPGTAGLPAEWPDGSVVITQWLADDLQVKQGDSIHIRYFRVTRARQLEEAEATFTVHEVLPMNHPAVRREWTPDFPGITESESCRDWKPGLPIDQSLIRPKDDAYWKEHKGTPKLFLTLNDGQKLWSNRFGNLTSLWVKSNAPVEALNAKIRKKLTPSSGGIVTVEVKAASQQAVGQSMDFGALFLSMSAFLIGTAWLLAILLFIFGTGQRSGQIGLLRATGWTTGQVRRLFLLEALCVAVPAAALGTGLGLLYTQWTLGKLERDWADAALGLKFMLTIRPATLLISWLATMGLSLTTVWCATRRIAKAGTSALLAGASLATAGTLNQKNNNRLIQRWRWLPLGVMTLGALGMLFISSKVPPHLSPMLFFGAAALILADGLRLLDWKLRYNSEAILEQGVPSLWQLGVRNAVRQRGRSIALTAVLAAGIFMVVALNAFRQDARLLPSERASGTGGFALMGTSTLPIYEDLNSVAGQQKWGFEDLETSDVTVVPFRVREGEEASCLNLNRAQTPRVMGVDPKLLAEREAFAFASIASSEATLVKQGVSPWLLLNQKPTDGTVPAIMDQYSAMFALGKKVGDVVLLSDWQGNPVRLRLVGLLAGTVLQGSVIIGESTFTRLFPDTGGFKYFLIDASEDQANVWQAAAVKQLANRGLALQPAAEKLAQFQAVQNTYLTIFSTLGGLALVLSTLGLGVLVARNVLERRGEFALLQAVGFTGAQLRKMVLAEHWFFFLAAVILGTGTSLLAVSPNLKLAGAGGLPVGLLCTLLISVLAGGLTFCLLAAHLALNRRLTDSLRYE